MIAMVGKFTDEERSDILQQAHETLRRLNEADKRTANASDEPTASDKAVYLPPGQNRCHAMAA